MTAAAPLEPDMKNWTWVLDRPCPECGFDADAWLPDQFADAFRAQGDAWVAVLLDRPAETLRARAHADRWSTLEYGCHVRDVFTRFGARVSSMLDEDEPQFANWDQDATAIEDDYGSQDPAVVARQLAAASASIAARYDAVGPDDWARTGMRSDGSAFTVESIARYALHDPHHHLWDIGRD